MSSLFALAPVITMFGLVAAFNKRGLDLRCAFMSAALVWGVILTVITEMLSLFHVFNFRWLEAAWIAVFTSTIIAYAASHSRRPEPKKFDLTIFTKLMLACLLCILGITFATAILSPPNNWDSMAYHMSRVVHWIQNQSVAHYPTNILRQIEHPPWAEFAIAHFQILSMGDYLANLIQWFCMFGCIVGVTLIAEKFGASLRGQLIAAVIAASVPIGILQSSSTQNDCVLSFWLVCLVYFGIQFLERPCLSYASAVGAGLGLALLTKGSAYIFAFPFMVWVAARPLISFEAGKLKLLKFSILIAFIALSLNVCHFVRNYDIFGNILGSSSDKSKYLNTSPDITKLISNIARNTALELCSQSEYINGIIESCVIRMHKLIGLDINDRESTWKRTKFELRGSQHEDEAGNPVHILLIMVSTIFIFANKRFWHLIWYICALIVGFLCLCFYLKWQPWHCRILLPLVILWSPVVATVIAENRLLWARSMETAILVLIMLESLPFLLLNDSRPIIAHGSIPSIFASDRMSMYFNNRPQLLNDYYTISSDLKNTNCTSIAIKTGGDAWEYPLWVMLKKELNGTVRIEHTCVKNESSTLTVPDFNPCAVVWLEYETYPDFIGLENGDLFKRSMLSVEGVDGGWITSDGLVLDVSPEVVRPGSSMMLSGVFNREWLPVDKVTASSLLDVPGDGQRRLETELRGEGNRYSIRISFPEDFDAEVWKGPVRVKVDFSAYFIPRELGINEDRRKLVFFAPSETRVVYDTDTIDFKDLEWPGVISSASGLSDAEPWGRWSSSDTVTLWFRKPLPEKFSVHLVAQAFGPNVGKEFVAHVGDSVVRFTLQASPEGRDLEFSNSQRSKILKIDVPSPCSPKELGLSDDERKLGIGLTEMRIERN